MLKNLSVFSQAADLARHAGTRHRLSAENIANADTPGYRAQDIQDFSLDLSGGPQAPKITRPGHMASSPEAAFRARAVATGAESPNGNTVSLEGEMIRATEAERSHDLAMTIYSKSLDLLRMSLGGRR